MVYIFYKRVNRKYAECQRCGKWGIKIELVRWVWPGESAYVSGHNANSEIYCSLNCAKKEQPWEDVKYIQVKHNTIAEINALGYPA
jgi:hypothetical protein